MWLVRDGDVLATAEVARDPRDRRRGLIGRDAFEGAFVIRHCRNVHTFGMRFPILVAGLDRSHRVIRVWKLRPRRLLLPRSGVRHIIEAGAGANIRIG